MTNFKWLAANLIVHKNIFYFSGENIILRQLNRIFLMKVKKNAAIELEKCKKKLQIISKPIQWSRKQSTCAWINKAAKTQRHIKKILPILPHKIGFSACVFLRLFINILLNQAINPEAQSKKTSFVVKENLNVKSSYVFANFVSSGFFYVYININICNKNGTGPKRIKLNVSSVCLRTFFLFAFGAFFLDIATHKALPIKSRRGAGSIFRHFTSFCYYCCLFFVTKKRNAISPCTFAVYFFFLFFALFVYFIQTKKNAIGR